jgi:uncharacterized protein
VVRLSESVYYGRSFASASVSVASHEVGYAIQHQKSYPALVMRHRVFPLANLASGIAPFLFIGGMLLQQLSLIGVGIIFFSAAVAFQLITLPVEFNASKRARNLILTEGVLYNDEELGVKKVLNAAALTYVAGALMTLFELIKFVMSFYKGIKRKNNLFIILGGVGLTKVRPLIDNYKLNLNCIINCFNRIFCGNRICYCKSAYI